MNEEAYTVAIHHENRQQNLRKIKAMAEQAIKPNLNPSLALSNPNCILIPAHPILRLLTTLLACLCFPDFPEFQILITSTGSHSSPIRAEGTTQYSTVVGGYIVYLLQ
jgi:hypothetical protein